MRGPIEPDYSCPNLDAAIEEIENARKIHDKLREWGKWWMERAGEIEAEKTEEIEDLGKEIEMLKQEIDDLKEELKYATRENSFA